MSFVQERILTEDELLEGKVVSALDVANITRICGHEKNENILLEAYNSGRLPHAWMFCGRGGIGKASMAFRFARFLLKEGANDGAGGGLFGDDLPSENLHVNKEDAVARHVAFGTHAGLLLITRNRNKMGKKPKDITVSEMRRIEPFLHQTVADGGWRIVIVDEAHLMNRSSQNAILKMLEEPPKQTVIILVTETMGKLVPTIRSRCRLLHFDILSDDNMLDLLDDCYPEISEADKEMLLQLAGGSFGHAKNLYEKGGLKIHRQILDILKEIPKIKLSDTQKFADKINAKRKDNDPEQSWKLMTESFLWWLRVMAMAQIRGLPKELASGNSNIRNLVTTKSPNHWIGLEAEIRELFETCNHAYLDRRAVMISAFQRLCV